MTMSFSNDGDGGDPLIELAAMLAKKPSVANKLGDKRIRASLAEMRRFHVPPDRPKKDPKNTNELSELLEGELLLDAYRVPRFSGLRGRLLNTLINEKIVAGQYKDISTTPPPWWMWRAKNLGLVFVVMPTPDIFDLQMDELLRQCAAKFHEDYGFLDWRMFTPKLEPKIRRGNRVYGLHQGTCSDGTPCLMGTAYWVP